TAAGTYEVVATVVDDNYEGSASGNLVIAKALAEVTLGSLEATYDGNAKSATATTDPVDLTVTFTYDGESEAPTNAGTYEVVATVVDDNYEGSASGNLVIAKALAEVTLGDLSADYDGTAKSASATTDPADLTVTFTYDGESEAPTNAGTYEVVATVVDDNYEGSATSNLIIAKALAEVTLGDLEATYDGSAKSATATTDPEGLTVTFTYDGESEAPTAAGSYAVVATVVDDNYEGSATGNLVIAQALAEVTVGSLAATYGGSAKSASATTDPEGLTVTFTYDGESEAPTNAGSYEVVATVVDDNYEGSATGNLVIAKALAEVTLGDLSAVYDGNAKS